MLQPLPRMYTTPLPTSVYIQPLPQPPLPPHLQPLDPPIHVSIHFSLHVPDVIRCDKISLPSGPLRTGSMAFEAILLQVLD